MADNFSSVTFPLEGSRLTFKVNYKILSAVNSSLTQSFDFQYVENALGATRAPTVRSLAEEFSSLIVEKLTPILGKNVQITTLVFSTPVATVSVPVYRFGNSPKNAVSLDTTLFFVLQSFTNRSNYRLYLKGASLDYTKKPLSEIDQKNINEFESLFISVLSFFDGNLKIQYVKNDDSMISCVFRESVKFSKRPSRKAKPIAKVSRPKPKKKVLKSKKLQLSLA
jgi:hypothetical protein